MLKEHIGFFHTAHSFRFSWCSDQTQDVFVGDFNADGFDDLLCHQRRAGGAWPQGKIGIAYNKPGSGFSHRGNNIWEFEMNWCIGTDQQLYIADFNGDGRDDMLCNSNGTEHKYIAFATTDGYFADISWQGLPAWCLGPLKLFTGDFNGDGRHDLLCKTFDLNDDILWISLANVDGTFNGTTMSQASHWCHGYSAELFTTGDFNGDGLNDLFCRKPSANKKRIGLMSPATGSFALNHWEEINGFCDMANKEMVLVDVNGDGRSDMLCLDIATGYTWIVLSTESDTEQFGGIVWENEAWCHGDHTQLLFGNFDGDRKTDALCKRINELCYTTSD